MFLTKPCKNLYNQSALSICFDIDHIFRYVGLKPKPKKRKLLMFNIPSKTTLKEIKMTFLLVSLVASHITLTIPINVTLFYWAYYPDAWVSESLRFRKY